MKSCIFIEFVLFCFFVFLHVVVHLKDADGMANIVDPDQTAPQGESDLGLQCLPRPIAPNILNFYASINHRLWPDTWTAFRNRSNEEHKFLIENRNGRNYGRILTAKSFFI